jgi:hypothetical protein
LSAKIHRLWEHTDAPGRLDEIADPIGQDLAAFRQVRDDNLERVRNWMRSLGGRQC